MFYVDSGRPADRGRCWRQLVATLHAAADAAAELPLDGDGDAWKPHPDPLVLVCTNGRHDACCATFGRPLARDLRQQRSPATTCGSARTSAAIASPPTS